MEGDDKSFDSCVTRVKRLLEHEGGNPNSTEVPELAEILLTGPVAPTEDQASGETFARDDKGTFPVRLSYHVDTKTYTAIVNDTITVTIGKRARKDVKREAKHRKWAYSNFIYNERRMNNPKPDDIIIEATPIE